MNMEDEEQCFPQRGTGWVWRPILFVLAPPFILRAPPYSSFIPIPAGWE